MKLLGSRAGIESISTEDGQVVLTMGAAVAIDRQLLQRAFGSRLKIGTNRLRLDMNRDSKEWKDDLEQGLKKVAQSRDGAQSRQGSESGGSH
jgi:hypothetical protein